MIKNTAGQKWICFAFNRTSNAPITGDAANITASLRLDGGDANPIDDTNPTELSGGYYAFDLTAAETNADLIVIIPVSATADVLVIGVPGAVWTEPSDRKYPATLAPADCSGNLPAQVKAQDDIDFGALQKASLSAATPVVTVSDKTGFSLSATGADLILKSSTFIQAIVAAINELTTYGLTALNTLLVTTGIKAASVPNVTLANGAHGGAATVITLQTPIEANVASETNHDFTALQKISLNAATPAASNMRGTDGAALASVCTEARLAELDAANLPADIADIPTIAEFNARTIVSANYATAAILKEVNQSLNGANVVIDRGANTFKVYDTDGVTLLFTITKTTVGNIDTLTRT